MIEGDSKKKNTDKYRLASLQKVKDGVGIHGMSSEQRSEMAKKAGNGYNTTLEQKSRGGIKSGNAAVQNKTGIHALAPEQTQANAIKAKNSFLTKMQNPEFRELHRNKIRYGKLKNKFDKLKQENFVAKTFYVTENLFETLGGD